MVQTVKNLPVMWETWVRSLGQEDPLGKGRATHSSFLAWRIPWTEEPDRLQPIRLQSRTAPFHFLSPKIKSVSASICGSLPLLLGDSQSTPLLPPPQSLSSCPFGSPLPSHCTTEKTEAQETERLRACAQGRPWVSGSGRFWRV